MATFVVLINWTQQGVQAVKGALDRAEAGAKLAEQMGARMQASYWTIGPYDAVSVIEAPDDETATAFALAVSSQGNVRTTTLRAYGREEMTAILDRIG